ncbi:sugar ABC transporter ATP-binding protein [Pelagibacterium xiamenense]|uniref:sugar ABC transporter ATP-binding protein n=1 Tax=Pelagibacterium xiamenense TaxID=2901140 RepID=UPI001E3FB1E0|nr:sugar ABC transporter ATP-binding protein [Pelagibacterium xiamenense]MCD7059737.1 sugar ABC transporter ATP-binding protein [Pelagibacterium xiamenense]
MTAEPILRLEGITKTFPGVKALNDIALELYPGQVTALIGENGAGKSTLVKIMTGIYQPDAGAITLDGEAVHFPSAHAALDHGITAIHQETVLFDELSVAENIFLGHAPRTRVGFVDWKKLRAEAADILKNMGASIDPGARLKDLSIANKHLVAVARALSIEAQIVIMDEPTAALSHKEIEELFVLVDLLRQDGKAILFISHKFDEIFRIADRYTVFRDGEMVGSGLMAETDQKELVRMMVGRSVDQVFPKQEVTLGETVLEVKGLSHPTEFDDINFTLRRGEILGFYGLVGAGRSELMQALFGATRPSSGTVTLEGKPALAKSEADAIEKGIVYVPEERGRQGAVIGLPIFQNISLPSLKKTSRSGFLDLAREFALARKYAERLDLRAASLSQDVGTLSGGNQQKVVIAKWLATQPRVIILDEPTKGIDIGSKAAVHEFMSALAAEGLCVIMVSSELPEIMGMSDRVIVMREGRIAGEFNREALDAETLVRTAAGIEET